MLTRGEHGKTPFIIRRSWSPLIKFNPEHSFYNNIIVTITDDGVKYD
jgi:hypothetical protein